MNKPIHIHEVMRMFDLKKEDMPDPTPAPIPVMQKRLDEFKEKMKKAYRKKALEMHPDQGGDEEEFKKLDGIYRNIINNLKIVPVRRPSVQVVRVYSSPGYSGATSSTTTSGGWGPIYTRWTSNSDDDGPTGGY